MIRIATILLEQKKFIKNVIVLIKIIITYNNLAKIIII